MGRIRGVVVIAALFLLFVAAGCGGSSGGSSESEQATTTNIGGTEAESHGTKDVSTASGKVEIELYDNYFEPTVLKGKPGQMVELELKNEGKVAHTFTLSEQSVDKEIQPGDETEDAGHVPAERRAEVRVQVPPERRHDRRPPGLRRPPRPPRRRPRSTSHSLAPARKVSR